MKNKIAYTIVRILLGLSFLFFGITKFFPFSSSTALPQPATDFLIAMTNTGYLIPFLAVAEILVGALLIFNLWVPLSMVILAPIMLNVILFNLFLSPTLGALIMLLVLVLLQAYIVYCTWHAYKPLFTKRR
jgi:putative oxidoreductase